MQSPSTHMPFLPGPHGPPFLNMVGLMGSKHSRKCCSMGRRGTWAVPRVAMPRRPYEAHLAVQTHGRVGHQAPRAVGDIRAAQGRMARSLRKNTARVLPRAPTRTHAAQMAHERTTRVTSFIAGDTGDGMPAEELPRRCVQCKTRGCRRGRCRRARSFPATGRVVPLQHLLEAGRDSHGPLASPVARGNA